MNSTILKMSAAFIRAVMLTVSVIVLLRGHNLPGGGFIGGLLAGAGIAFYVIAFNNYKRVEKTLAQVKYFSAAGLTMALSAGLIGVITGNGFMKAEWLMLEIPLLGTLELSTPLLFDIGVYFTVIGVMVTVIVLLMEERSWK